MFEELTEVCESILAGEHEEEESEEE